MHFMRRFSIALEENLALREGVLGSLNKLQFCGVFTNSSEIITSIKKISIQSLEEFRM